MNETFKDHFSGHARLYSRYRPTYPPELFRWLTRAAGGNGLAWDCGTGSGQAAVSLAEMFSRVVATDASAAQIGQAFAHPGVEYRVEAAEKSSLATGSADLVFVSQALHWFDLDLFYREVQRVLRPGGLFAAVTFLLPDIDPAIDLLVAKLYEAVGPWWPPERRHVDAGYTSLPFPFQWVESPVFCMSHDWRLADLQGYLSTWSAVQRFITDRGVDPVAQAAAGLEEAWGDPSQARAVSWSLVVWAGRVA